MVSVKTTPAGSLDASFRSKFPRLLFVNELPPDDLGTCSIARQMLAGYPAEQLHWWYSRGTRLRGVTNLHAAGLHQFSLPARLVPGRKLPALRSAILEWVWTPLAARHLSRTVSRVNPDVIWVLMFSWPILVANRAKFPSGPRLHATLLDFPDTADFRKIWGLPRCRRFVEAVFQLIRRADSWDGVSSAMLEEIKSRTGRDDGILTHPGFEEENFTAIERHSEGASDGTVRIAYVGTIISWSAFLEVIATLESVRSALPQKLILEFFGNRGYRKAPWFKPEWMVEHEMFATDQELVQSLRGCSWGLIVMDPAAEDPAYSQFSFPGKTGPYLSAGLPLLAVTHPSSTLAEMMRNHKVGLLTSKFVSADLQTFFAEALHMSSPRSAFRDAILRTARTEFDANAIRSRLWRAWGCKS